MAGDSSRAETRGNRAGEGCGVTVCDRTRVALDLLVRVMPEFGAKSQTIGLGKRS